MPETKTRVAISFDALLQRLNRHLRAKEQYALHTPRGRGGRRGERKYFIVDLKNNTLVAHDLTPAKLEEMARKEGVMKGWEELER
jgi:hypothetical protein